MTGALLMSLSLAAAQPEQTDPDRALLQGSWRAVSGTVGGEEDPTAKGLVLTFRKDRLTLSEPGQGPQDFAYRLDSSKTPKHLDIEFTILNTTWIPAIYALDKDTLTVCFPGSEERPTEFAATPGTKNTVLKLERVRPDPEEARLQGSWRVVSALVDGEEAPEMEGVVFTFHQGELGWALPGRETALLTGPYTLDTAASPKRFAWTSGLLQIDTAEYIYTIEGDTLTVCGSRGVGRRPEKFESPKGGTSILCKLERVKE